jgi:type I restriction enzyme S subunit
LYLYLKNFNYASLGSTSSIAKAINSKIVRKMLVLIPDQVILNIFREKSSKIFHLMKNNQLEIIKLEKIRDILLPKLMSGEIDVSNVKFEFE